MGQQQIFLIVLGVIVVGIAIVIGLENFQSKAVQANRDAVIIDLNYLASDAQVYYKKTITYGGGEHSFTGYDIPLQLKTNANGTYRVLSVQPLKVTIEGIGVEKEGELGCSQSNNIKYRIIVKPGKSTLRKIN
jgi:hypothetical protein